MYFFIPLQQFPYPGTSIDPFLQALIFGLDILIVLSFIYTAATVTKVESIRRLVHFHTLHILYMYKYKVYLRIQWNLSNLDTLGTEESVLISEVS